MMPGARSTLGAMTYFGSKSTVLKKVLVTLLAHFGASCSHSVTTEYTPFAPSLRPA